MKARTLAVACAAAALLPGCGLLFSVVRGAFDSGGGPLREGVHAHGDTSFSGSQREMSCAHGEGAPQHLYTFVAPRAALYMFESHTTDYDGVLSVRDPVANRELACNDDTNGSRSSEIELSLEAGQRVEVVQGGYQGNSGRYELYVEAGTLSGGAATGGGVLTAGVPTVYPAATRDVFPNVCGAPDGSLDRQFTFTAAHGAFYAFYSDTPAWLVVSDGTLVVSCTALGPDRRVGMQMKAHHRYLVRVELGPHDAGQHALLVEEIDPTSPVWAAPPHPTTMLDAGVAGG